MSDDEYVVVDCPKKTTEIKETKKTYKDMLLKGSVSQEKQEGQEKKEKKETDGDKEGKQGTQEKMEDEEHYYKNYYGDHENYGDYERYEDDSLAAMDRETEDYEDSKW